MVSPNFWTLKKASENRLYSNSTNNRAYLSSEFKIFRQLASEFLIGSRLSVFEFQSYNPFTLQTIPVLVLAVLCSWRKTVLYLSWDNLFYLSYLRAVYGPTNLIGSTLHIKDFILFRFQFYLIQDL